MLKENVELLTLSLPSKDIKKFFKDPINYHHFTKRKII